MADRALETLYRGDTRVLRFTVTDGAAVKDITGYKFFCTIKVNQDDADSAAVLQVSTTAGDNQWDEDNDDVANGKCYLVLSSTDTNGLTPGERYFYDLQRVAPGTPVKVKTLESGYVKIKYDATRATT